MGSKTVLRTGKVFPERRNARQGEPLVDGGYYTQEDIKEIVAYAGVRQIEVVSLNGALSIMSVGICLLIQAVSLCISLLGYSLSA